MLYTIFNNGGIILILIGCLSLVALTVAIERAWRLLPLYQAYRRVLSDCEAALLEGKRKQLKIDLQHNSTGVAQVVLRGLELARQSPDVISAAARERAQREVPRLERGLGIVATVAQIAPLLGLLGTVVGLMEAFAAVDLSDTPIQQGLANGVYKALGTTAAGIAVAVPAWIALNTLNGLVSRCCEVLEQAAGELPGLMATSLKREVMSERS